MMNIQLQEQQCPSHYIKLVSPHKGGNIFPHDFQRQSCRQNPALSKKKKEHFLPKHSKIDEIILMCLLKRSAGDDRGWKHTFWAWTGSRWKEFTALARGPNSWLCRYDSLTRQPTRVPDSPRKHYESRHGRPSVSYLRVFKSADHVQALDIHGDLKYCRDSARFSDFLLFIYDIHDIQSC